MASRSALFGKEGGYNEYRYNQYDATGRLQNSKVVNRDPNNRTVQNYSSVAYHNTGTTTGLGYDAAGNLLGYRQVGDDGKGTVTTYTYKRVNGGYAQDSATTLKDGQNAAQAAKTQTWYDANGFISNIVQPTADDDVTKVDYSKRFNRAFVNDAQGNVLYVNQGAAQKGRIENPNGGYIGGWVGDSLNQGNIQRQMVVGGEVFARYGSAPDSEKPLTAGNAPNYVSTAEFYVGASPMQLKGANLSPVSYTVAGGETLKDIARNVLGDASLWWRIAEANALALGGDTQLAVGQTLTVPKVALNANSAETLQPYEPGKVIGSQDPVLPVPAAKGGGCGGLGKIIMVVVAIVVTIYTAGALAAAGTLGSNALGAATLAGATTGGGLGATLAAGATVLGGGAGMGAAIAAGALAGAAGSIASQVVGNAIGAQDGFSWKSVGLSALSGGVTAGLAGSGVMAGTDWGMTAARAATANALTQGIGVVTGLQKSFDWKGVAGAAVGAGVGQAVGSNLPAELQGFTRQVVTGFAAGTAAAIARGGKVAIQQVATDAFGNALGTSLLDYASNPGSPVQEPLSNARESFRISEIQEQNWNARTQKALALAGPGRWDDDMPLSAADQYVQNFGGEVLNAADRLQLSSQRGLSANESNVINTLQTNELNRLQRNLNDLSALSAQIETDKALNNMQGMADAYRAAGYGTGDPYMTSAPSAAQPGEDRWFPNGYGDLDGGTVVGSKMTQAEMDEFDRLNPPLTSGNAGYNAAEVDRRIIDGSYDMFKATGSSLRDGRWGDAWSYISHTPSQQARDAAIARVFPQPTLAQQQLDVLAGGGPLATVGYLAARARGASPEAQLTASTAGGALGGVFGAFGAATHARVGNRAIASSGTQSGFGGIIATPQMTVGPSDAQEAFKRDFVGPIKTGFSKQEYDYYRRSTPSQAIRDMVNPEGPKFDPIYGYPVNRLEADHLQSFKEIMSTPGLVRLPPSSIKEILNLPENFVGLGKPSNASKGTQSFADWPGHSKLGPIDPNIRNMMLDREAAARAAVDRAISQRLNNGR